jgi:hypothetical protein
MATKRQKERKKKNREEKAKSRVESRRNKIRAATREEGRARRLDEKFREKIKPFVKDPERKAEMEAVDEKKVREKLERNMQILKALEEEYESEVARKAEINRQLESQGHETLKEKLNAIEDEARKSLGEASAEFSEPESNPPA